MKTLTSFTTRALSATLLGSLLSLSVLSLSACAGDGDPLGEGSQPISDGDSEEDASEGGNGDACALGAPQAEAEDCQAVANGLCFATAEAACACDGCALDQCLLAESFPVQAFCQSDAPSGSDPDEPVSSDGDGGGSDGSSCDGSGGGSDPHPGDGDACAEGTPRASADAPCDMLVDGLCFFDAEVACACAGCAPEACLILESYPAQIRCATSE